MFRTVQSLLLLSLLHSAPASAFSESELRQAIAMWGAPDPLRISYPVIPLAPNASSLRVRHLILTGNALWLELGCRSTTECLPFYALATYETRESANAAMSALTTLERKKSLRGPNLIRVGARVQVSWLGSAIELQLDGRALQTGRLGERIRVMDERRRVFRAIVRSSRLVEMCR